MIASMSGGVGPLPEPFPPPPGGGSPWTSTSTLKIVRHMTKYIVPLLQKTSNDEGNDRNKSQN